MKNQQSGFTLIELIAVIVILGILAATAVPKFVDLSDAAETAALSGIKGGIESAAALNYALDLALEANLQSGTSSTIADCSNATMNLIMEPDLDTTYTVSGAATGTQGTAFACNLSNGDVAKDLTLSIMATTSSNN